MTNTHKIIQAGHYGIELDNYDNYKYDYSFNNAKPVADQKRPIPSPLIAKVKKNPVDTPENKVVHDFIWGLGGGLKVTARVKELFEVEGINAEYVPLEIIDVNGKTIDGEFYTVKALEKHEVFDLDKSTVEMNDDQIFATHTTKLVGKENGEYKEHLLVIPTHLKSRLVMSTDLIKKFEAAGFTNLKVTEFSEYKG